MKAIVPFALALMLCGCQQRTERFRMPTGAMSPTVPAMGHVIADTTEATRNSLARWDMIVFRAPETVKSYGMDPGKLPEYVIRIAAMPGEEVDFGGTGILVNGAPLESLRIPPGLGYSGLADLPGFRNPALGGTKVKLGPDEYFILGDSTKTAMDSRSLGPLPKANIIGKVTRVE